jgi:hypothetical protein
MANHLSLISCITLIIYAQVMLLPPPQKWNVNLHNGGIYKENLLDLSEARMLSEIDSILGI